MARTTPLTIYRGEDITLNFTQYTTDTGSTAEDITGWTLSFTVAREANSTTKLLTKSCSLVVAASGTFRATVDDTDTDSIAPGRYYWDVWRTDAGFERLLGSGSFNILGNARIPPSA
jgi:hypothetical protein